jgi:hypothetical protein
VRTPWWHRHLLIGSDEQLRALGLLTLDFGAADEALAYYISSLSDFLVEDSANSAAQLQEVGFCEKVQHLKKTIQALSDRYLGDGSGLFEQLDAVRGMASHRNDIVHGWVQWDAESQQPAFRNKKKPLRGATAGDISRLCKKLENWLDEIRDACLDYLKQLREATNS